MKKKIFPSFFKNFSTTTFIFLLVMPASPNYKLKDYGFGTGGVSNATSSNYSISAIAGEASAGKLSSDDYKIGSGLVFTNQANVPAAPTFSNSGNYYNKLQIGINTSGNPSLTKYAIAISDDNFVTTRYVQSDNTIGAALGAEDYQVSTSWDYIIGLTANTTYKVKVKAIQGKFTETEYGPIATAATVNPTLSFAIRTDTQNGPPLSINYGVMETGNVNNSPQKIWADMTTNGENGCRVYVSAVNAGLISSSASYTINSITGNLNALSEGFGAQGVSVTQTSGGPLAITDGIYNQSGNTVGIVNSDIREIFNSAGPISGGSGSFQLKAKPATTARPAADYTETFKLIVAGSF